MDKKLEIIKAFDIWKYLIDKKMGFCFDEDGIIWDVKKCQEVIDNDNSRAVQKLIEEYKDLYYQHNIK